MSWKDKLFGSRILAIGRRRYKKNDGTTITVTKDILRFFSGARLALRKPVARDLYHTHS